MMATAVKQDRMKPLVVWSNAAYVVCGLASGDPVLAVLLSLLGVASFLYHSKLVPWGGYADCSMMYGTMVGMLAALVLPWWVALLLAGVAVVVTWRPWWTTDLPYKVGLLWALLVLATAFATQHWWLFIVALVAFAAGLILWLRDPAYERWEHAAWHALTPVGFLCLRLAVV